MKACPLCGTVDNFAVYCPRCRKVKIVVKMLTLDQLRARLRKNQAGAALIEKAAKALEGFLHAA